MRLKFGTPFSSQATASPSMMHVALRTSIGSRRRKEAHRGGWPDRIRSGLQDGAEGIVSKRKGSPYRIGRSPDWLKMKNPAAPTVKREAEEDWGRRSR